MCRDIVFDDEGCSFVQFYVEITITVFTRHMEHDKIRLGIYGYYYPPAIDGPLELKNKKENSKE